MADAHLSATLFAMEDEFRRDISVNSDEKESPSVATVPTYPVHLSHARGISIAENGKLNLNPFSPFIWKNMSVREKLSTKRETLMM